MIEPFFPLLTNQVQQTPQSEKVVSRPRLSKTEQNPAVQSKLKSISNLGVSISSISEEKEKVSDASEKNETETLSESFTPIELLKEWKAYTESLIEEHHLKNTMLNCLPDLQSRDVFEVVVNNPVQEQRLLDSAGDILSVLRRKLRNSNIQMKVRVTVDNEKKLGFTSLEKFNLMIEQNETLKRLKDEFGLELM